MKYILAVATACAMLAMTLASAGSLNKRIHVTTASNPSGDYETVNGSITVEAGVRLDPGSEVSSVNGTIRIGSSAIVGELQTVNGSVKLDDYVQAAGITTVNGSIRLGENVSIAGNLESVNGALTVPRSSSVDGNMENVNGKITVDGGRVEGSLIGYNGGMLITQGATIGGDVQVKKPRNSGWRDSARRKPEIVIGPDARVYGNLIFEQEVELYVHASAQVGSITGADPIRFSGDTPD